MCSHHLPCSCPELWPHALWYRAPCSLSAQPASSPLAPQGLRVSTNHPPQQLYLPIAASLAAGPRAGPALWKGTLKPFPALPLPPGSLSPPLDTKFPWINQCSQTGPAGTLLYFHPHGFRRELLQFFTTPGSPLQRLGRSRRESEPRIWAEEGWCCCHSAQPACPPHHLLLRPPATLGLTKSIHKAGGRDT